MYEDELLFANAFEAKGELQLAEAVRHGRIRQRLYHCFRENVGRPDWFVPQFQGLQALLFGPDHPEIEWETWKTAAMKVSNLN